jgi:TetR/AcrR family tetracycline transcriptional repressor
MPPFCARDTSAITEINPVVRVDSRADRPLLRRPPRAQHETVGGRRRVAVAGAAKRRRMPTEAEIVTAALQLVDAGGPEAASIRRIAAAVDVAPTTVYRLFPDRAAVEMAVVERLLAEIVGSVPAAGDRPWQDGVEALVLAFRNRLADHPGAARLFSTRPMEGPNALRYRERLLTQLAAGGLDDTTAARGAYLIMVFVLGSVVREAADAPRFGPLPPEAQRIEARRMRFAAIPPTMFPMSAAAAAVMAAGVGTGQFRWGLRRVLAGLADPAAGEEPTVT